MSNEAPKEHTEEELAQIGRRELEKKRVAKEKAKQQFEKNKSITYSRKRLRTVGNRLASVAKRLIECVKTEREEVRKANARNLKVAGARKMKPKDTVMEEFLLRRTLGQLFELGKNAEVDVSASSDIEDGEVEEEEVDSKYPLKICAPAQDTQNESSGSHDSAI